MKKTILLTLVLLSGLAAENVDADFTFGTPTNLGPLINSSYGEAFLSISADGLMLYFTSDRPDGYGGMDLWVATRKTTDDDWGTPENLGPPVNTSQHEYCPCISSDGLELYFGLYNPEGNYIYDIWVAKRPTINDAWGMPIKLEPPVNTSGVEDATHLSIDGLELYFTAYNRAGGYGADDIWITRRATKNDPWGSPINLGAVVNSSASDDHPFLSADGLALFFSEDRGQPLHPLRPGGFGDVDMWVTTRSSTSEPWGTPVNLGPIVNSTSLDGGPIISPDGFTLYFSSERPGGYGGAWGDIYQAPIIPIVDLNSDGIVDGEDLRIIGDNWGTDNSLCDIGPMPWGDGIVDVQDLIVIAKYLQPAEPEEINVNEENDGGQVELELGQILVVTLESNPTTGYSWQQAENQEPILEQMGEAEFKPSETGESPLVGTGGWEIFRFKAISPGQMTLKLIYRRPWEEGVEPVKTFTLDVIIH
jgi:predicted secreted protein